MLKISQINTTSNMMVQEFSSQRNLRITKKQITNHIAKKFGSMLADRITAELFRLNPTLPE